MKFKIDRIIEHLEALKEKQDFVTENELLNAAIVKVNTIDNIICMLKTLHERSGEGEYCISELENILSSYDNVGISRQTIYRWIRDGIITTYYHKEGSAYDKENKTLYHHKKNASYINTVELLEALERIKAIQDAAN